MVAQRHRLERCFERELRPALAEHGIRIVSATSADEGHSEDLHELFRRQVFPALTPLVIGLGRPFPYISNLSLSLAVLLRDPEQDNEILARVKVPTELLGRFLSMGSDEATLIPLEDLIAANLGELFLGMEVLDHSFFRVTRDTDYDVSDEADNLLQAVEEELKRRRFGEVVRLEVASGMNRRLREPLVSALGIEDDEVYEVEGMLDFSDLFEVAGLRGFTELRDPPHTPVTQPRLRGEDGDEGDVFAAMREGDVIVHHPYDSFVTSVERFVEQAVADPDVLAIKQTVYRTSADSPLVPSLIDAAERGKQAVCMVELKARFDERANIRWAKKLEEAGVHVVYGIPALKTHCKCVLVVRREGEGVRHYVHVGTGNYNPKTARLYTDLGLFTADPEIGSDIAEMFNYLTGYARPRRYRKVKVAPFNLHTAMLRGDRAHDRRPQPRAPGPDPDEDELAARPDLDPGSVPSLPGGGAGGAERARDLRPAPRGRGRLGQHRRRLRGRQLPRALQDLLVRAPLRGREDVHRLGRPDAPQPLQPRRAADPDRGSARAGRAARHPRPLARRRRQRLGAGRGRRWRRRTPAAEPRSVQREMIALHSARAAESAL